MPANHQPWPAVSGAALVCSYSHSTMSRSLAGTPLASTNRSLGVMLHPAKMSTKIHDFFINFSCIGNGARRLVSAPPYSKGKPASHPWRYFDYFRSDAASVLPLDSPSAGLAFGWRGPLLRAAVIFSAWAFASSSEATPS